MPDSPGDDHDSRTASVGLQRNSRGNSSNGSRPGSVDPSANANPRKRQRRNGRSSGDARDFVPQGSAFSASSLPVDPDDTSSSGSDSSDSDSDSDMADADTAQTGNWNQGAKSAIRTSLSSRKTNPGENQKNKSSTQFDAVNGKYWRSRSESMSSAGKGKDGTTEEGEISEGDDDDSSDSSMQLSGDSDDSSLDSEADDSILLNIGSRNQDQNGNLNEDDDEYDPEALPVAVNGTSGVQKAVTGDATTETKEDAFARFALKYPSPPVTLADLTKEDMDTLARMVFYDRSIHDINLQLPVTCTECFREGHLAAVCPLKECVHCGSWSRHQSSFCPQWRRCQKCRARGHDEEECTSPLKGSAAETPCDLCGSSDHLELECDFMWKLPLQDPSGPVHVSLSCCRCTSNRHLVGDCPSQPPSYSMLSSSWTLRGIDPQNITNINSVVNGRPGPGSGPQRGGLKIRGRADRHSGTSDSDDMIGRPDRRPPMGRNANANRPNIKIGSGIGKNKGFAPAGPRAEMGGRPAYRDRQEFPSGQARQRSLSPNPRPSRGRGGRDSWQPSRPRSPPRGGGGGRGRPPPARGSRGGRGGGRGGAKRGGGDGYRPMPSAAKKAWDKYRL